MDQHSLIEGIRAASLDVLDRFAHDLIQDRLPTNYLQTLGDIDRTDALRACLIVFVLTATIIVPRQFQLEAVLATLNGQDSVITAGTGSGKTLCIIIPILLRPGTISITISPLKRLQATQVLESTKYGIPTISINEDTAADPSLWESIRVGKFTHLIVSPEQLSMFNGHLPRLARLLRQDQTFTRRIKRVHVDEAHSIYTAGLSHHGEEAFRPAYGKLGELRVLLSKGTTFQALSATLPPHILSTVKHQLMMPPDHIYLALSANRQNITYATTPLIGGPRNFHNFDLLIPAEYRPPMLIPKTLVFHDNKQEAADAAAYNDSRLPKQLQNLGIVKHYHSDMSAEYLQQTYDDFASVLGTCCIIHATSGASTGLDIQGVMIVIQYGIPKNLSEALQRGGRAVRDGRSCGLYLMMIETWALEANLTEEHDNADDPDRPYAVTTLKKNSSKRDRTGCATLRYVQSKTCLREFFAKYLNDQTPTALHYVTITCCDRHPDSNFNLSMYFLGSTHSLDSTGDPFSTAPPKRKRNRLRDKELRTLLLENLHTWRAEAHSNHPLRSVWPITWICDDGGLELLSKTHQDNVKTVDAIVTLLEETVEWGKDCGVQILKLITQFDEQNIAVASSSRPAKKTRTGAPTIHV